MKTKFSVMIFMTFCVVLTGCRGTGGEGYTVIYDGNGADSGTVPVDSNCYQPGVSAAVLNAGTLGKSGDYFVSWNTASDGSGSDFLPGASLPLTADVTLYAQWDTVYLVGDTGPAGGTVFYDDHIGHDFDGDGTIQADEMNLMAPHRYLEVAPSSWNGGTDPNVQWGSDGSPATSTLLSSAIPDALAATVGTGSGNTAEIVAALGSIETGRAAQLAAAYAGGGETDWFLPSIGELEILYFSGEGSGFTFNSLYWSSTEFDNSDSWGMIISGIIFSRNNAAKVSNNYVRPVRGF